MKKIVMCIPCVIVSFLSAVFFCSCSTTKGPTYWERHSVQEDQAALINAIHKRKFEAYNLPFDIHYYPSMPNGILEDSVKRQKVPEDDVVVGMIVPKDSKNGKHAILFGKEGLYAKKRVIPYEHLNDNYMMMGESSLFNYYLRIESDVPGKYVTFRNFNLPARRLHEVLNNMDATIAEQQAMLDTQKQEQEAAIKKKEREAEKAEERRTFLKARKEARATTPQAPPFEGYGMNRWDDTTSEVALLANGMRIAEKYHGVMSFAGLAFPENAAYAIFKDGDEKSIYMFTGNRLTAVEHVPSPIYTAENGKEIIQELSMSYGPFAIMKATNDEARQMIEEIESNDHSMVQFLVFYAEKGTGGIRALCKVRIPKTDSQLLQTEDADQILNALISCEVEGIVYYSITQ